MSLSLISSILPPAGSLEKTALDNMTSILLSDNSTQKKPKQKLEFVLAKLILNVALEGTASLLDFKFKDFDALVKNLGCQITAAEVHRLVRSPGIREEAARINLMAEKKIEELKKTLPSAVTRTHTDLLVSESMARLLRLKLLCLVNDNRLVNKEEVPFTNFTKLKGVTGKVNNVFIETLIHGIQADESRQALRFIRSVAEKTDVNQDPRAVLIRDAVSESCERTSEIKNGLTPIVSVPLFYNAEVSLRSIKGIVLVKNKLHRVTGPIAGAKEIKVFVEMPENKILSLEEVAILPKETPIVVIEGFINNESISDIIAENSLIELVKANASVTPQFASGAKRDSLALLEAQKEIDEYKKKTSLIKLIPIDHFYCSSLGNE